MYVHKPLVTKYDPSKAFYGYTLFGPAGGTEVYLINMEGNFVHRWCAPRQLALHGKLLQKGKLLVGQRNFESPIIDMPGAGGELIELDWDGNVVWKYEDPYLNSHDFDRWENGNTLVTHWAPVPEDIAIQVKGGIPGSEREGVMWGDVIQEVTPHGEIIWEWKTWEHMDFETDILCPLCPRDTLTYINSLVALPDGNILTHFRLINTIAVIDKNTGDITWKWGADQLGHAHNPTMLENGNVLIFDNGFHRRILGIGFPFSRVIEINTNTGEIEWEYKDPNPFAFYSSLISGAQRLSNGNTLICDGTNGRLFEVTHDKEIVWEFHSPFFYPYRSEAFGINSWVFRAYRFDPEYEGLKGRELDPDKYEFVLTERKKEDQEEMEKLVSKRLAGLGY